MGILRHRRRPKLRPLDEAEAYARCHGQRNEDVKIVHLEPRRPRYTPHVSGERLREAFERRLDAREPEDMLEPDALPDVEPLLAADAAAGSEEAPELQEALGLPAESEARELAELDAPTHREGDGEIAV
jgi:hypothetical protein